MEEHNCLLCWTTTPGESGGRRRRGRSSTRTSGCDEVTTLLECLLPPEDAGGRQRDLLEEINSVWREENSGGKLCAHCDMSVRSFWELKEELESIRRKMKELEEEIRTKIRRGTPKKNGEGLEGLLEKCCQMIKENDPSKNSAEIKFQVEEARLTQGPKEQTEVLGDLDDPIKIEPEANEERTSEDDFHDDDFLPIASPPPESPPSPPPPRRRGRPARNAQKPKPEIDSSSTPAPKKRKKVKSAKTKASGRSKSTTRKFKRAVMYCDICSYSTDRPFKFENHLRGHDAELKASNPTAPFRCNLCATEYYSQSHYNFHQEGHKGKYRITCDICSKICLHMDIAKHLKEEHALEKVFQCPNCSFCGSTRDKFMEHLRFHGKGQLPCEACGVEFRTKDRLLKHLDLVHHLVSKLTCDWEGCDKTFYDKHCLSMHRRQHNKTVRCEECDKRYPDNSALKIHMRSHTGEKIYVCQEPGCIAAFMHVGGFKRHQIKEHGAPKAKCEDCGKEYNDERSLQVHRQSVHFGVGIPCGKCPKMCANKTMWRRHQIVHREEATHICHLCGKAFKCKEALSVHLSIHKGDKKLECSYCGKKFLHKRYLRDHERIHTGERPYVCNVCGKSFTQLGSLLIHNNKLHVREKEMEAQADSKNEQTLISSSS